MTLPAERMLSEPLVFLKPGLEELIVTAHRLLKFEFPPTRNYQAIKRFALKQLCSPKLSKKTLEQFSIASLEKIHAQLWQATFPESCRTQDTLLTLAILAQELIEFKLEELVRQDILLIGQSSTASLHSYYYSGPLDPDTLETLLVQQNCRTDLIKALADENPLLGYLLCRALSSPLPWSALLENLHELDGSHQEQFPQLIHLLGIHRYLKENRLYAQVLDTPENILLALNRLTLLFDSAFKPIASQTQSARPVRELVIVEGATEHLLLPYYARSLGLDLNELGIFILPAGGKNQVIGIYKQFETVLNAPMFIVLDQDAHETAKQLRNIQRLHDYVFQLEEGEFEDTYEETLMLKTINEHYRPYPKITRKSLEAEEVAPHKDSRVETLKALWKIHDLGTFDKSHFAAKMAESLTPTHKPHPTIQTLLKTLVKIRDEHALASQE